jgi:hypothetical protein
MSAITPLKPNALPGRGYGSFRRPFVTSQIFILPVMRSVLYTLQVD